MSHLVAVAYPDVANAAEVRNRLMELQRDNRIQLDDMVVVEKRADDKIRVHQNNSPAGHGVACGMWGGLIGLVFLAPYIGMAVGPAAGGAMADAGIDDDFMRELGKNLQPGGAALFMLAVQSTPDKIIAEIGQHGGKVVKTSLSKAADEQLREAMKAAQAAQGSAKNKA